MDYSLLKEEVKRNVIETFQANSGSNYVYHNLEHTESVVMHAEEIASHYQLNDQEHFIVTTAAWFHDIGYFSGGQKEHEIRGAELAELFLKENNVSDLSLIDSIKNCILATAIPQSPKNLLEQIVCDADLFHFGTNAMFQKSKLLHREFEITQGKEISKKEWRRNTICMLENHHYFTDYCRWLLNEQKDRNLKKLQKKEAEKKQETHISEHEHSAIDDFKELPIGKSSYQNEGDKNKLRRTKAQLQQSDKDVLMDMVNAHIAEEQNEENYDLTNEEQSKINSTIHGVKQKKKKRPERGIDTVFKITSNNNQRLSSQADSKAHIMIQVNSIIISVLISMLFRKIEEYNYLAVPAVMLLSVNVGAIIFSVLATRPQLPSGTFSKQDIDDKKVNLLFFGNFYKMTLEDYASGMLTLMDEYDFLYMSLIRDVYFQGKVLGRKYHLLRISYNVFMYGLVLSIFTFMISFIFFAPK